MFFFSNKTSVVGPASLLSQFDLRRSAGAPVKQLTLRG